MDVKKLFSLSLFYSLQEDYPVGSSGENGEEFLSSAARCYHFDDSDDDVCEDGSMVSLMNF